MARTGCPADCPAYDRATTAAVLSQLHTVFAGAALAAALAAVAAVALLRVDPAPHSDLPGADQVPGAPFEPIGYNGCAASPFSVTRPKVHRSSGLRSTIGYS